MLSLTSLQQRLPKNWQGILIFLFIFLFASQFFFFIFKVISTPEVPPTPNVVQKYSEIDLNLGDSIDKLQSIDPTRVVETKSEAELTEITYKSAKNANLHLTIWHDGHKIKEIRYPLLISEAAKISEAEIPDSPYQEFWNTERPFEKMRIYNQAGFAIRYHSDTETIYEFFLFFPEEIASFLAHHPGYSLEEPQDDNEVPFTKEMFKASPDEKTQP